jgi:hypothetical protein
MPWKRVTFDASLPNAVASGKRLEDAFDREFVAAGGTPGAVMLKNFDRTGNRFCYFLSPAAVQIAAQLLDSYSAVDCLQPPKGGATFLVGNAGERGFY